MRLPSISLFVPFVIRALQASVLRDAHWSALPTELALDTRTPRPPSTEDAATQLKQPLRDDVPNFLPAQISPGKNTEDETLDMRPAEVEPTASEEQMAARFNFFRTEPIFQVPKVLVEHMTDDESRLAPGYYFTAPYGCGAFGPQIFDQDGSLVYWGANQVGERVTNFSPCSWLPDQQTHLCWSETFYDEFHHGFVRNRVFDNTYTQVGRDLGAVGGSVYPNSHEFNMLRGGNSFVQVVYEFKIMNLTAYNGPAQGWVYDGCFQEVDSISTEVLFSWCATDHFPLHETYMYLNIPGHQNFTEAIAGTGTFEKPWDFMHLNAVDKTPSGDYIVSSRHFNSIFKVEGSDRPQPGRVIWHLGGKSNDFEADFKFSRQHHVRHLASDDHTMLLSLFNNGFNVRNPAALEGLSSNGQVLKLDEGSLTATLLHNYTHPNHDKGWRQSVTIAEGSMDFQSANGGVVIGWGSLPDVSEFAQDGALLFHASIADHTGRSYRVWKKPWIGRPHWAPALVAYSQTCGPLAENGRASPLIAYASWNGATEVVAWRFSISTASRHGPWFHTDTVDKQGFETKARLTTSAFQFVPYVKVEALDIHRAILGDVITATFVPLPHLACDTEGCAGRNFTYLSELSIAADCPLSPRSLAPAAGSVLLMLFCLGGTIWLVYLLLKRVWLLLSSRMQDDLSGSEVERHILLVGRGAEHDAASAQPQWMLQGLQEKA